MERLYNLKLPITPKLPLKEQSFYDAKYELFVNKDRLCSAEVRYVGDRELSEIQRDKILKPQLERILRSYIKLLNLYDKYEPDTFEIDKILKESNDLQYRLLKCIFN